MTSQLAKYWSTEYEPTNSTLDVISRGRVVHEILCSLKYVEDVVWIRLDFDKLFETEH